MCVGVQRSAVRLVSYSPCALLAKLMPAVELNPPAVEVCIAHIGEISHLVGGFLACRHATSVERVPCASRLRASRSRSAIGSGLDSCCSRSRLAASSRRPMAFN